MENRLEAGFCSCLVRAEGGLGELLALGMHAAGRWLSERHLVSLFSLSLSHAYTGSNRLCQGRVKRIIIKLNTFI